MRVWGKCGLCYLEQSRKNMNQRLFRFEVDQSIRIEQLNDSTALALANEEKSFVIKIPARVKRQLAEYFRYQGKPKKFAPKLFAIGIVLIIKKINTKVSELVIDIEYPGYELLITDLIKIYFPELLIYFSVIGKKSTAHFAAYGAHIGKRNFDAVLTVEEIKSFFK